MTGPTAVERLYFGHEDAERDMANGLLATGFVRTAAYDIALDGRKMLVIGRKGSGKSAICVRLAKDGGYPGDTALVTPDDAVGDEIRRFELQGLTGDAAKSLIWRYVFAVQAARQLVGHGHGRGRLPAAVRALRRFLRANGESVGDRLYDRLARGTRGLQTSLSLEAFGVKASVDMNRTGSEGARASRQLEVIESGVARAFAALGCAGTHSPLLLLVDQLEQVWSNDPDSHAMVIGLLLAAKHVAGHYGGALRCLLFLRSDIYDALEFGEGDKFHGDELRIEWTGAALHELLLARARASVGAELTAEQLWGEVFPRRVDGVDTAAFLFGRCLPRPRDVIQYLNLCRDTAVLHGHAAITEADVLVATRQFSEWKLQDLAKEYLVGHPYLGRLSLLFENVGYVVMRDALESRFGDFAGTLHAAFPDYVEALTPAGVIDTLYSVGFLGVRRGADVVYAGGAHLPVQPHEVELHIHPCFRPALGATKPTPLVSFQPESPHWQQITSQSGHRATGSDAGSPVGRDFALLDGLSRSCDIVQRQVGRAVGLPDDARAQLLRQLTQVKARAAASLLRLRQGRSVDAAAEVLDAAAYFTTMAAQLRSSHLDDGRAAGSVVRQLEDEAGRLGRAVGGSSGGSGYANS